MSDKKYTEAEIIMGFDVYHNNSYLGATLHPHNKRIVSLMRSAFKAGVEYAETKGQDND